MSVAEALLLGFIAHGIGDYVLQSDWMALEKTKRWLPALAHALSYGLPFVIITQTWWALALIVGTHYLIDRYRLARYVVWAKNMAGPARYRHPWAECTATGYHADRPAWMTVWLLIVADNVLHVTINSAVLWSAT